MTPSPSDHAGPHQGIVFPSQEGAVFPDWEVDDFLGQEEVLFSTCRFGGASSKVPQEASSALLRLSVRALSLRMYQ